MPDSVQTLYSTSFRLDLYFSLLGPRLLIGFVTTFSRLLTTFSLVVIDFQAVSNEKSRETREPWLANSTARNRRSPSRCGLSILETRSGAGKATGGLSSYKRSRRRGRSIVWTNESIIALLTTNRINPQLKPWTTTPNAVPAAGACSVSVAAIRKMLRATARAASTSSTKGICVKGFALPVYR